MNIWNIIQFVIFSICALWISGLMTTIYNRIPNNIPIGPKHKPRCNHCYNILTFKHFIPIFSFIYYKGKCPHCGINISKKYLYIETISTILMIIYYLIQPLFTTELILNILFIAYLVTLFFIYLDFSEFKDSLAWALLCFTIMNHTIFEGKINLINISFIIAAIYSGLMLLERKKTFTTTEKTIIILAFLNLNNIYSSMIFMILSICIHHIPILSPFMLQKYKIKKRIILISIIFNIADAMMSKVITN